MIQPSYGHAGSWSVSCNGQEVNRLTTQGVAIAYASSMALVAIFERRKPVIEVKGRKGVVWSWPDAHEATGGLSNAI